MIHETSNAIEKLLSGMLYPNYLASRDLVKQCIPHHDQKDFCIGIYLYDITSDDHHEQRYANVVNHERIYPDKVVIASYIVFVNEEESFGGYSKQQEEELLEELIRIFHNQGMLEVLDDAMSIQFENPDMETKIRLWQSFQKPLQPALYIKVSPLRIPSRKSETVSLVHEVDIKTMRK